MDYSVEGRNWAEDQYMCFYSDCLVPCVKAKTRFTEIWNTYQTYCQAVQQVPAFSKIALARRLQVMFTRRMVTGKAMYGCTIRKDLFVQEGAK